MKTMDLLNFDKEEIIYGENPRASVLEYNDTHGFTPELLIKKNNVVSVYQNSIIKENKELVLEYICKVQGLYYIYLTLYNPIKLEEEDNYKMRLYYDYKDRQQINLLLTSFKNARN
jgi:hypothetical protein